jgi:E3 ubiquitin-protein ligase RNF115/126
MQSNNPFYFPPFNTLEDNQNSEITIMKKYWCHLCKKEFIHKYENDDIKCSFCGKTFCEIIENEDTSNASHPMHFETFNLNNTNGQNNINNSQNRNGANNLNNLNHFNRRAELFRRRANHIVEFLANYFFIPSPNDNIDNIISHIMLHDTNKYGNPPAAKKAVESLKKYKINEEKIKEFGFENSCAVCKEEFNIGEECLSMPCNHYFHGDCLIPWLKERNSCPVCRYELPTDDADFEKMKKYKLKNENNNNSGNNINNRMYNDENRQDNGND